jgi:glycosyltransferase involved in cell wall biosynthesis
MTSVSNPLPHADADSTAQRRYAIITPYYREPRDQLERCLQSVRAQTVAADHIVVADGHAQDWLDQTGVRHLKLDRAHGDYGNTPRAIGALLAIAEQYDGIGLLDADNWLEADHVERCVTTYQQARQNGGADYVIAKRNLCRLDGSVLLAWEESYEKHVDTNCFFFFPTAYPLVPYFGTMPREMASIGDRFFFAMLRERGMRPAISDAFTVNYLCVLESFYRALGEEPPPGARPNIDMTPVYAWLAERNPEERLLVDRLTGLTP